MEIREVLNLDQGAQFYRGDLHIHSFAASHDVSDTDATPERIVETAKAEGLSLIAIADHNEISNVAKAIDASKGSNLFLVPAVELSTSQGHILCYLPSLEALTRFFAKLQLADRGGPNSRCVTGMVDVLNRLQDEHGFAILAHVDGGKGLEESIPGNPPHKKDIICHPALLGIELKNASSQVSYSDHDPDQGRKQLGRDRIDTLKLGKSQFLARVLNSDSHSLKKLGHNASGDNKVTRYKMQKVSFEGLRLALSDADARVRIEDEVPANIPKLQAITLIGGFLDGQAIHFGPNLNCIIGGRGTGKSTTFEAIRHLTGQPGGTDVCDSDVWPDRIELLVQDQAGQEHHFVRDKGGVVEKADSPFELADPFPVECYGQGQTQAISQRAQSDPAALLDYLDRFVDVSKEIASEDALRDRLLDLADEIAKAQAEVDRIPGVKRDLDLKKSQLATLEKEKGKEVIELIRKVEGEKQLRQSIVEDVKALISGTSHDGLKAHSDNIATAADPSALVVGEAEYRVIAARSTELSGQIAKAEEGLKLNVRQLSEAVQAQLTEWKTKDAAKRREIEAKKEALEAQGIRLDMVFINRLSSDEAELSGRLRKLEAWIPALADMKRERARVVRERWKVRSQIATKRTAFAVQATGTLKEVLGDLQVSLKFEESTLAPTAADLISDAMGWKTSKVPRASLLIEKLTLPKLLEVIQKKDYSAIQAVRTSDGSAVFSRSDAEAVVATLAVTRHLYALEAAQVLDRPVLTVTKAVAGAKPIVREFKRLSLGQQQSVLLALMLSANSNRPLIIDQPEDNLDSEFIYYTLVPVLRRAKERRQVIVVTHNANIAVLGDAEQILVLKSNAEKAEIKSRGSIDHEPTKKLACAILEGSEEAFLRRARIYGVVR